jgi:hypothetical protein
LHGVSGLFFSLLWSGPFASMSAVTIVSGLAAVFSQVVSRLRPDFKRAVIPDDAGPSKRRDRHVGSHRSSRIKEHLHCLGTSVLPPQGGSRPLTATTALVIDEPENQDNHKGRKACEDEEAKRPTQGFREQHGSSVPLIRMALKRPRPRRRRVRTLDPAVQHAGASFVFAVVDHL